MTFLSVMSVEIANVVKTVKGGQNGEFWSKLRKLVKILIGQLFPRHIPKLLKVKNYFKSGDSLLISVLSRPKVMNLVTRQCGAWWALDFFWKSEEKKFLSIGKFQYGEQKDNKLTGRILICIYSRCCTWFGENEVRWISQMQPQPETRNSWEWKHHNIDLDL